MKSDKSAISMSNSCVAVDAVTRGAAFFLDPSLSERDVTFSSTSVNSFIMSATVGLLVVSISSVSSLQENYSLVIGDTSVSTVTRYKVLNKSFTME